MLDLSPNVNIASYMAMASARTDKVSERLSSGLRITKASDDAAGLTIAETMRAQSMGSQQAQRNIQDAIHVVQLGEDGVNNLFPVMQRIRELIVEAGNGTKSPQDLQAIQAEIDQIKNQVPDSFAAAHQVNLALDPNPATRTLTFQVGANAGDTEKVDYTGLHNVLAAFTMDAFGYKELFNSPHQDQLMGVFGSPLPLPTDQAPAPFALGTTYDQAFPKKLVVNPNTTANMNASFGIVDTAVGGFALQEAVLGAAHNRLTSQLGNVSNYTLDISGAESQIRDADMAKEMSELSRSQITQQATTALFGQANTRPQILLQLLQK